MYQLRLYFLLSSYWSFYFFLLRNFNSPNAQTKILVNAIDNDDNQKVATLLSTKDNKVDPDEASAYIKYIKKK